MESLPLLKPQVGREFIQEEEASPWMRPETLNTIPTRLSLPSSLPKRETE